jgi:hypothetical protein
MRPQTSVLPLFGLLMLSACASHEAYRTHLIDAARDSQRCPVDEYGAVTDPKCDHVTPEILEQKYELHFVEFDDQGWRHPQQDPSSASAADEGSAKQIDALMARLKQLLKEHNDLKVILFVHGWKHNADSHDDNVKDFRLLLERAASDELYQDRKRKVVGIYVGWRGKPWTTPDALLNLSFWSRKDTATRVSVGSVRELFARIRSMQRYFNTQALNGNTRPHMRTLMIGHSFGELILYAATSGPLIEVLTAQEDLADLPPVHQSSTVSKERYEETERIADMIVLVNPAFEASRFEALYRVANQHKHTCYVPPLLLSITSMTDNATGMAFLAGRFVNTLFERPTSSSEQASAIKQTPGHMDSYLTHMLYGSAKSAASPQPDGAQSPADETCPGWLPGGDVKRRQDQDLVRTVTHNKSLEVRQAQKFIAQMNDAGVSTAPWTRTFCGGARLEVVKRDGANNAQTLVWNVLADREIIDGHGDVMNPALLDFVRQMFGDTDLPLEPGRDCGPR